MTSSDDSAAPSGLSGNIQKDDADLTNPVLDSGDGEDIVHKALNDTEHDSESENKKENEEPEKRRKREEALSEEDLNKLREESRTLKNQGNDQFGQGFWYEAAQFYTKALDICPLVYTSDRATYLSNRAAAYMKVSDWENAAKDCTEALDLGAPNDKPLERRAYCYAQIEDKYEKAVEDYESLLKMHPDRQKAYAEKIFRLKQAVDVRNEKMKEEMISKLKDLGNMCLKPFGLSTDNFELTKQPGGGYSINMKKT